MVTRTALRERVLSTLPPDKRRRLGRIKRAVLDQPEPSPPRKKARRSTVPVGYARSTGGIDQITRRRQHALAGKATHARILEIGPAHYGIATKRDGFDVTIVDYLDRESLVRKYAGVEGYRFEDIEEVDYVLAAGSTFAEAIDGRFDVVVAAHVIEHSVSLVDFINDLASLTAPGGHVALVVPDHRACFDRFRPRSSLGAVIDAVGTERTTHSAGTLIEFAMNHVRLGDKAAWGPRHAGTFQFSHTNDQARAYGERALGPDYVDVHHWVFTPHHLRLMLADLADLGYLAVRESHFAPTHGHEFYLNLSADATGPELSRSELVELADEEYRTLQRVRIDPEPARREILGA